jgi:hypothetical protein
MHEAELLQVIFQKHRVIQYTLFESGRKNIFRAFSKFHSLQLAIIENNFGIRRVFHFAHGQIAANKFTGLEIEFAQVLPRKTAIFKGAVYKVVVVQNRSDGDGFVGSHVENFDLQTY